jgi:predicted TIM-barrel fold metal-dependent hydrolase
LVAAGVRGLRLFSVPTPAPSWLDDPDTWPVWEAARDLGVHLGVCCLPAELGALDRVLAAHPETDVVLDHCGFVDPDRLDLLDPLHRHEHLVLKVTSHVLTHAPDPAALVDALIDRFGADRLVWGSDHPQVPLPYPAMVSLAEQALTHRSGAERAALLGSTALRLWPELSVA